MRPRDRQRRERPLVISATWRPPFRGFLKPAAGNHKDLAANFPRATRAAQERRREPAVLGSHQPFGAGGVLVLYRELASKVYGAERKEYA